MGGENKRRAFLSVKTQFENLGDALIIRELIQLISRKSSLTVDLSRCPPEFSAELRADHADKAASFGALIAAAIAARISGNDVYYFLVPGGFGGEKSGSDIAKQWALNLFYLLLRSIGVKICQLGVSYDNLGARFARILAFRSRMMHSHVVRDKRSLVHAEAMGIRVDGIAPDLALNLFSSGVPERETTGAVAFSFRTDKYPHRNEKILELIQGTIDAHPELTALYLVSQVRRDDKFARELKAAIKDERNLVEVVECKTIEECRDVYRRADLAFSNRLHVLLLAASVGASPFALVDSRYDVKISGVFEGLELRSHLLDIESHFEVPKAERLVGAAFKSATKALDQHFGRIFDVSETAEGVSGASS